MALTVPKRCDFCAHKLVEGKCKNEKCIDYKAETTEEAQETERAE